MLMSRAKTLCSVVHEIAGLEFFADLVFNMSVKGSNGSARYVRHNLGFYLEQKLNKDGPFVPLVGLSELDFGTLSKVSFENADAIFMERVVSELKLKKFYLWLLHKDVMKGEFLYRVLKSSTTASDYAEMLRMYNVQAANSASNNPNLTKINTMGQPSRAIWAKYADIPINCEDFAAYPASYVIPSRPPMPARHCAPGTIQQAPDGTWWWVECPGGPQRRVCQWKADQVRGTYVQLEQPDGPGGDGGGGGPGGGDLIQLEDQQMSDGDGSEAPDAADAGLDPSQVPGTYVVQPGPAAGPATGPGEIKVLEEQSNECTQLHRMMMGLVEQERQLKEDLLSCDLFVHKMEALNQHLVAENTKLKETINKMLRAQALSVAGGLRGKSQDDKQGVMAPASGSSVRIEEMSGPSSNACGN